MEIYSLMATIYRFYWLFQIMETKLALTALSLMVALVHSFPTGAPRDACRDGIPQHGFELQPLPMPYDIRLTMVSSTEFEGN